MIRIITLISSQQKNHSLESPPYTAIALQRERFFRQHNWDNDTAIFQKVNKK